MSLPATLMTLAASMLDGLDGLCMFPSSLMQSVVVSPKVSPQGRNAFLLSPGVAEFRFPLYGRF